MAADGRCPPRSLCGQWPQVFVVADGAALMHLTPESPGSVAGCVHPKPDRLGPTHRGNSVRAWRQWQAAFDYNSCAIGPCDNPDLHERRHIGHKRARRQIGWNESAACVRKSGRNARHPPPKTAESLDWRHRRPVAGRFAGGAEISVCPACRRFSGARKSWPHRSTQLRVPKIKPIRSRVPQAVGLASTSPAAKPAAAPCCTANARKWSRWPALAGGNWLA